LKLKKWLKIQYCKVNDEIFIASFDIGKVNFAFCIEKCLLEDIGQKKKDTTIEEMCSKGIIETIDNVRLVSFPKDLIMRRRGPRKGTTYRPSGKYAFESLLVFLEQRKHLWNKCHIFVIEQQMSQNKEGLKISYHLEAYFKTCYGTFKEVVLFPSFHKTHVFQSGQSCKNVFEKISYSKRKKACVDKAFEILNQRKDQDTIWKLERSQKRDDMCDVICQLQAYKWIHLMEP
jgi:hypothetical protein